VFSFRILILFFLSLNIFASDNYIDSLTLTKIKKLVQKEEEIATAYKKYILDKGVNPTTILELKNANYLPKGFNEINPFGKQMKLRIDENILPLDIKDDKHEIENFLTTDLKLKSNLYDYYYTNTNRVNTKAPMGINNNNVEIILSTKEKFIYTNKNSITTIKNTAVGTASGKYYLDANNILHWYESGKYKFSINKDLIVDENVNMLDLNGNKTDEFKALMLNKNVLYSGETIVHKTEDSAGEYINLGNSNGIIKVNSKTRDIGKTVIQFTRRAGGMIVNGDIYTWGNNANKVTGIDIEKYTKGSGNTGSSNRYPVITGLVRAKVKTYNSALDDKNYFSSPLRPKFVDFFSTVYHGTCGVSIKGELYCGGVTASDKSSMYTDLNTNNVRNPPEMFYRSNYFDGTTDRKATKIFANNQIWLMLGNTSIDANGDYKDGKIYRWGYDYAGFSGGGSNYYNNYNNPTELVVTENNTKVLFKDITYLLTIGYRKTAALSNSGDIYIWGLDTYSNYNCSQKISNKTVNLCSPLKISASISFTSIQGGLNAFVAKGEDGKYYKVSQPWGSLPLVESVNEKIKSYTSQYVQADDSELIWVDFTSDGIVWINSKNELKGDYFTSENRSDTIFKSSIAKIKWKKIKVIEDDNGMCGIDIYNQMYCWGMQSFYRSGYATGNTFMIPVFNTNLYDINKDYLVAEGGDNLLTNMTSGDWTTSDSKGPFFIKYPTYIGGFNYEFIFK
jgi:hypothetical protein